MTLQKKVKWGHRGRYKWPSNLYPASNLLPGKFSSRYCLTSRPQCRESSSCGFNVCFEIKLGLLLFENNPLNGGIIYSCKVYTLLQKYFQEVKFNFTKYGRMTCPSIMSHQTLTFYVGCGCTYSLKYEFWSDQYGKLSRLRGR